MFDRDLYIQTDTPLKKTLLELFNFKSKLVILDIGACEGEESIRYSRLFPNSSLYAFEPLPKNKILITENIKKYNTKNVILIPLAVSNYNGIFEFFISSGNPENQAENLNWDFGNKSSSLLEPEKKNMPKWLSFENKIEVQTITLETFLIENKIEIVDFIHMDVQGAELKVLEGAKKRLEKVKAIWLEVSNVALYKSQPLTIDVAVFMKKNNFCLVKSSFEGGFGDQLYLNKNYFKTFSFFNRQIQFHLKINQ
jgi:FkbM family methyltransferase